MRDDVKNLFNLLVKLYSQKNEYLQSLLRITDQKKSYLHTERIDDLLELIEKDNEIINNVDSLNYEIGQAELEVCNIIGIEKGNFFSFIEGRDEEIAVHLKSMIIKTENNLKSLIKIQDELTLIMKEKLQGISNDIESLSTVRKLKKDLPPL